MEGPLLECPAIVRSHGKVPQAGSAGRLRHWKVPRVDYSATGSSRNVVPQEDSKRMFRDWKVSQL